MASHLSERASGVLLHPTSLPGGQLGSEAYRFVDWLAAEFAGVEIERDYDPSLPELIGDREQLIQALLNIARNAAQAGAKSIVFRTRAVRQITILRQRFKLALELQVVDDGPGVPEEIQDRIFSPLVSGREGGSGLGLSLAQTFIQYHQGVIEFESRPGRTTFRILLPIT